MKFYNNQYFHLYNRTNNEEALFRSKENYIYFLKKYRYYVDEYFDTIAYCLMPTHFHFLVRVKEPSEGWLNKNVERKPSEGFKPSEGYIMSDYSLQISRKIGTLLNSYSQAFNKMWNRHGNLFNQSTKAKLIEDEKYFMNMVFYIHQNPLRSDLVDKLEDWEFSSYQDYIDLRKGSLPNKELIKSKFTESEIINLSNSISDPRES